RTPRCVHYFAVEFFVLSLCHRSVVAHCARFARIAPRLGRPPPKLPKPPPPRTNRHHAKRDKFDWAGVLHGTQSNEFRRGIRSPVHCEHTRCARRAGTVGTTGKVVARRVRGYRVRSRRTDLSVRVVYGGAVPG